MTGKILKFVSASSRNQQASSLRSPEKTRTPRARRLLHSVECFLQQLQVGRVTELFACVVDPFPFECIFGGTIRLIEDAEDAGEGR